MQELWQKIEISKILNNLVYLQLQDAYKKCWMKPLERYIPSMYIVIVHVHKVYSYCYSCTTTCKLCNSMIYTESWSEIYLFKNSAEIQRKFEIPENPGNPLGTPLYCTVYVSIGVVILLWRALKWLTWNQSRYLSAKRKSSSTGTCLLELGHLSCLHVLTD